MMRAVEPVARSPEVPAAEGLRVSVVVPVFNSAASLDELHERIDAALEVASAVAWWELILVNDGSADGSWERIVALAAEHRAVRGLDLTRNWGQHNALLAGVHAATGDVIVTLDDDLQNPPEEISALLDALAPGVDLVYGKPRVKRHTVHRRVATRVVRGVVSGLTRGGIPADIGGFRAFRAGLLDRADTARGADFAIDTPLTAAAAGIVAVSVRHDRRRYGRSNYTLRKLAKHTITEFASLRGERAATRGGSPTYAVRAETSAPEDVLIEVAGRGAAT